MKAEGDAEEEEDPVSPNSHRHLNPSRSCPVAQQVKDVCGGASLSRQWSGGVRLVLRLKMNGRLQTDRKGRAS